jgi:hypothetical protein
LRFQNRFFCNFCTFFLIKNALNRKKKCTFANRKKRYNNMKKITLFVLSICFVSVLSAQTMPPTITSGKWWNGADGSGNGGSLTGSEAYGLGITTRSTRTTEDPTRAPLAPATLLLLGLGGAAVGTTVLKNTRKK